MIAVIVNPVAGNGRAKKIYKQIRQSSYLPEETKFYISEYKGHICKIIRQLESVDEQIELLFIIGGDGTVHEVVNALTDQSIRIAYIPGGSGNDFARGIHNQPHIEAIIEQAIEHQKEAHYWLCTYDIKTNKKKKFINCLGFGFDAIVVRRAKQLGFRSILRKLHLDTFIYLIALLQELFCYQPVQITLTIDGVKKTFHRVLFLTINNQPYMGGGMKINPEAFNKEQRMSMIVVDSVPKWKVFLLFGTVFLGKHTSFRGVHLYDAEEIIVSSKTTLPYQVDGEYGETNYAKVKKHAEPIYLKGIK